MLAPVSIECIYLAGNAWVLLADINVYMLCCWLFYFDNGCKVVVALKKTHSVSYEKFCIF